MESESSTGVSDEELAEWEQDDPYNSILMRRRFPLLITALRAERTKNESCQRCGARVGSSLCKGCV